MAAPDIEIVEISLLSGRSDRPSMTFTPGTPSPTVSIGSAGQWAIAGEGVGPVHVFVTFDGQSVHVAAAIANLPAALAGVPIGTGWTKAPIPCELRFGGACVILRRTSRPSAFAQEEATMHDGGALWHAAQHAAQQSPPVIAMPVPAPEPAAAQYPPIRPAAGIPAGQTTLMSAQSNTSSNAPPPAVDLGATTPLADAQKFREAVLAAQAGAVRPPAESSPSTLRQPVQPGAESPFVAPAEPLGELEKTVVAPHPPRPPGANELPAGVAGEGQPPPAPLLTPGPMPVAPPPAPAKPPNYWQTASPVKKATLILMPFALIMAFLMLHDEPPPPAKVVSGSSNATAKHAVPEAGALAAAATNDAGLTASTTTVATNADGENANANDAGPATSGSLDAKQDPGSASAKLGAGKRTPERMALDAVAAGSFDDAAKRYDALTAAHADDPSYKEAARILHEKAGN